MPPHRDAALRLQPFHGVRYAPSLDLAAVTAPPYDVLDDEAVAALDASDPHNIVRLVLPRAADRAARRSTTGSRTGRSWSTPSPVSTSTSRRPARSSGCVG